MKRELTCIICPRGCALSAEVEDKQVCVSGNACPRGEEYAVSECLHPVRTVTATLRVANRCDTMVSIKTERPVSKDKMPEVMQQLRNTQVNAPLFVGDVVLQEICGSRIIVTKTVL